LLGATALAGAAPPAVPVPGNPGFPAPPRGAVVFARQLGFEALALGVVPQRGAVLLQASLVNGLGKGMRGVPVTFTVQGSSHRARACGPGCYRASFATAHPRTVDVRVRGTPWRVALPAAWPAPDASELVARAERVWRSLRSVSSYEELASSPRPPLRTRWRMEAPDRVAYQVRGGWAGVVVGEARWDRAPGSERWVKSSQTRLTQPVPGWASVKDAHLLGSGVVGGRPVWRISFFDPGTPAWFTIALDKQTLRTLDVWMIATAHFMHDAYGSFNSTKPIEPPS
jgi:hypothetical protein